MINRQTLSIFTFLVILLITFVTTYYAFYDKKPVIVKNNALPDAYMDDVVAVIMDKLGHIKMKIISPKMIHFETNDRTRLIAPQFTLYRNSPNPWFINSKYGEARQGTETIFLWNDVVIRHPASIDNPVTLIKTSTLTIHPNDNTAETNDAITMTQPNLRMRGVGMLADMNSGDIKLLADARGEYVPT